VFYKLIRVAKICQSCDYLTRHPIIFSITPRFLL